MGRAYPRDFTAILNPSFLLIILNGLNSLNNLKSFKEPITAISEIIYKYF